MGQLLVKALDKSIEALSRRHRKDNEHPLCPLGMDDKHRLARIEEVTTLKNSDGVPRVYFPRSLLEDQSAILASSLRVEKALERIHQGQGELIATVKKGN